MKIIILWATCRPEVLKSTHKHWIENSSGIYEIDTHVAVDTKEQKEKLEGFDVIVTEGGPKGVCFPAYCLSRNLEAEDNDVVILASDDFFPPKNWDKTIVGLIGKDRDCVLLVNDGIQKYPAGVVTFPIMTFSALKKMKKIIYNPVYSHMSSDCELYVIAERMCILKDVRKTCKEVFEHRHYCNGKRERDEGDKALDYSYSSGRELFRSRMKKNICQLIRVDPSIEEKAARYSLTYKKKEAVIKKVEPAQTKLSILICSIKQRQALLQRLLAVLQKQQTEGVEILTEIDDGKTKIGRKRNNLLDRAKGNYVCFIDDDDLVAEDYVSKILEAIQSNPDCCSLEGIYTVDGKNPTKFIHSFEYKKWETVVENGKTVYLRCPNHLNAIKSELAVKTRFNDVLNQGEDRDFSERLLPLLKKESKIEGNIYQYLYLTKRGK